ncbi:MAG: hypothetical protein NTX73_05145 [Rhodobacterales bacterium]|nr:hypothetical protein [Rhodobacterales bacterium]
MRLAFTGLILPDACAAAEVLPDETVDLDGQSLTFRHTPTGDVVPHYGVAASHVTDDCMLVTPPSGTFHNTASYPTLRIGGTTDSFVALTTFFQRCLPGETFDRADYSDAVFTLDERTDEWVFTYPCQILESAAPGA